MASKRNIKRIKRKTKRTKRKTKRITRKQRKILKGGTIKDEDIMYQDKLVCILRPDVKKGIIVWTNYVQPADMPSLCEIGLKTGHQLNKEKINFGRTVYHPHIFFRAPYYSSAIDYSSIESEVVSSYGHGMIHQEGRVFIRVDPDKTFVFSSEIRVVLFGMRQYTQMLENSKKTLTEYLRILNDNEQTIKSIQPGQTIWYNLFSSKATIFKTISNPSFPFNNYEINRNSEILVSIPHLTPNYFVLCNPGKSQPRLTELYKPNQTSLPEASTFEASPFGEYSSFETDSSFEPDSSVGETRSDEASSESPESIFKVTVLKDKDGNKVYQCPICHSITGTNAPKNPRDTSLFTHNLGCKNKNKIPVE